MYFDTKVQIIRNIFFCLTNVYHLWNSDQIDTDSIAETTQLPEKKNCFLSIVSCLFLTQRMKDSDESLRHLAAERDETEREKWTILKHARDESERVVKLSAQLSLKEATVKKLQEELDMVLLYRYVHVVTNTG